MLWALMINAVGVIEENVEYVYDKTRFDAEKRGCY